jgi:hypothetical protein
VKASARSPTARSRPGLPAQALPVAKARGSCVSDASRAHAARIDAHAAAFRNSTAFRGDLILERCRCDLPARTRPRAIAPSVPRAAARASAGLDVIMTRDGVDDDLDGERMLAAPAALVTHQKVSEARPPSGMPHSPALTPDCCRAVSVGRIPLVRPAGHPEFGLHVLDSGRRIAQQRVSFGLTSWAFGPETVRPVRSTGHRWTPTASHSRPMTW